MTDTDKLLTYRRRRLAETETVSKFAYFSTCI